MASQKRRPQPCGDCGASEIVLADGFDFLRDNPPNLKKQVAHRGRAKFARAMVFEMFPYKHARAIDYDGFVDRKPDRFPKREWAAHGRRRRSHRKLNRWWRP